MYSVRREYDFSSAHRLGGHPKCGRLHGHNYHVWVTISHTDLNLDDMVIDFSEIDKYVDPIIDAMDHRYLKTTSHDWEQSLEVRSEDVFELPRKRSTAENIAEYICTTLRAELKWPTMIKVEVGENRRSVAAYVSSE